MCYEYDALPPDLPAHLVRRPSHLAAAAGEGDVITLRSADGTKFAAYHVKPGAPTGAGIVILPDVRGLYPFYQELAKRFAEAGVEAITIDYFGRTAGAEVRDDTFDFMAHVMQTKQEQVAADVAAAVAYLRDQEHAPSALFTVGFCFGGANSLHQAANGLGLAGVIAFYGGPKMSRMGGTPAIERVADFACPVLGLYGGADQGIPVEDVRELEAALKAHGVPAEIVIYPDTPHSFFDRKSAEFADAAADSWTRVIGFIKRWSKKAEA